jgi:hypothetical protein
MNFTLLWKLLSEVKTLELHAASLQPKWHGTALGKVVLSTENPDILIFSETGEWNSGDSPRVRFFNIYRWRMAGKGILELSHLRNGINSAPVHLLDFKQTGNLKWHSEKPHLCHEDVYTATLTIAETVIELDWNIKGPAKNQTVKCFYS